MVELRSTSAIFGLDSKWIIYSFQMTREVTYPGQSLVFLLLSGVLAVPSDHMTITCSSDWQIIWGFCKAFKWEHNSHNGSGSVVTLLASDRAGGKPTLFLGPPTSFLCTLLWSWGTWVFGKRNQMSHGFAFALSLLLIHSANIYWLSTIPSQGRRR